MHPMKTELSKAATSLFRYLDGQLSDVSLVEKHLQVLRPDGLIEDNFPAISFDELITGIKQQPGFERLFEDWRSKVKPNAQIELKQAPHFLNQLFSTIEDSNAFLKEHNIAFSEVRRAGDWRDFKTSHTKPRNSWTLKLTTKGHGRYTSQRQEILSSPGDILLFSPSAPVEVQRDEQCNEWHVDIVVFNENSETSGLMQWPEIAPGIFQLSIDNQKTFAEVKSVIQSLINCGNSSDLFDVRIRATYIQNLLIRCQKELNHSGFQPTDLRVKAALEYIEENLTSDLCVERIAQASCLSVSTLNHLFKKYCGVSVMLWREKRRLTIACNRLVNTQKRISEVSDELGYLSQMYFARTFRRHMNMTPSEYRKLYQVKQKSNDVRIAS